MNKLEVIERPTYQQELLLKEINSLNKVLTILQDYLIRILILKEHFQERGSYSSGRVVPSSDDIRATKNIKKAANIMERKLLDHIIVGNSFLSMREEELLENW